jgi:hypothetical protein
MQEKTAQVRRMREIYEKASKVLIWLGYEVSTDKVGFQLIKDIYGKLDMINARELYTRALKGSTLEGLGLPDRFSEDWAAVWSIWSRKYFQRKWIIQEYASAREAEIWCGSVSMPAYYPFRHVS